jgi:hypothetical protein
MPQDMVDRISIYIDSSTAPNTSPNFLGPRPHSSSDPHRLVMNGTGQVPSPYNPKYLLLKMPYRFNTSYQLLAPRSLSDNELPTAANAPRPSASCSARKSPQRIPANTPPVFPGLRPRIWRPLLRLVTRALPDRLLAVRVWFCMTGFSHWTFFVPESCHGWHLSFA